MNLIEGDPRKRFQIFVKIIFLIKPTNDSRSNSFLIESLNKSYNELLPRFSSSLMYIGYFFYDL